MSDFDDFDEEPQRYPPPSKYGYRTEGHQWTDNEMHIMLCLIAQGEHLNIGTHGAGMLDFATKFNVALNGKGSSGLGRNGNTYDKDIEVDDIKDMLVRLLDEKKAAVALIERMRPKRITRRAKLAFARSLDFDGSMQEWEVEGRKEREKALDARRVERWKEEKQREADKQARDEDREFRHAMTEEENARLRALGETGRQGNHEKPWEAPKDNYADAQGSFYGDAPEPPAHTAGAYGQFSPVVDDLGLLQARAQGMTGQGEHPGTFKAAPDQYVSDALARVSLSQQSP